MPTETPSKTFTAPMLAALPTLPRTPEPGTYILDRTSKNCLYRELSDEPVSKLDLDNEDVQEALNTPPCEGAELKLLPFGEEGDAWVVWVIHNVIDILEFIKQHCKGHWHEVVICAYENDDEERYATLEIYDQYREDF